MFEKLTSVEVRRLEETAELKYQLSSEANKSYCM
jgi:hypothetical protein